MKIIVADDSALFREGLSGLLERRGHSIVGRAKDTAEMMELVRSTPVDVLVTDVRMPPTMTDDGLRAAIQLREEFPHLGIMVLSQYIAPAYARKLFYPNDALGGLGYVLKDSVAQVADFIHSLEVIAAGGVVINQDVALQLVKKENSKLRDLTDREREILALMAQGYSNAQLAEKLFLSNATISKHVANIFIKLGMDTGEDNRRVRAVLAYLSETQV
ncbi:response regulator transcription factor [Actinotignum urinale]|uniref:response regulator transcription factor n=1 Tax=Actinotignum urinale TaxID=190146 RepID=UPI00280BDC6B|nr:response regulator transcription factor [Actinotignum urinale]